ncbi:MAG: FecR domain-containing protein, partial [Pseudomonadota bacterium]|nr:FecR domain-containing protein [Pseudomonadota bacterium]
MKRVCCSTAASSAVSTPAPRWRRHVVSCAALWIVGGSAWAVPSATVLFASGDAHVLSASGQARPASPGVVVESGESIETGKGSVQLRMVDGGMMSLNERTLLRMDDYHLAGPAGDDEKGYMSLVRGALRTISGSIGKARVDRYKLDTPTGTIGIRGTEYTAAIDDGLRVGVVNGRVAVCNDGGCVDVPKGSSAYTAQRSVKPTVTTRVSVVVSPAHAGPHTLAAADAPATATPPQASTATP